MPSNCFSNLHGAIKHEVQRTISRNHRVVQEQENALIGRWKLRFVCSGFHHAPSRKFTDQQPLVHSGTVATAQANSHVTSGRKNLSVVGAVSHAISIPSVSSPSFQVCGYHFPNLFSESSPVLSINLQKALMATCGYRFSLTNCLSLTRRADPGVAGHQFFSSYSRRSFHSCSKVSMSSRNKEQPSNLLLYGYFIDNVSRRKSSVYPFLGFGSVDFKGIHISSSTCSLAGTAHDVSFDNSTREEQQLSSADSSELNISTDRRLKLNSASCYLPHPDKEETGGEDAHFICSDEQAIGVADGVGGWADLGVNSGFYARELMSNSVNAIQDEPQGFIDPTRVLEKAYTCTKAKGSSTACIIALTDQGLHAINLGDSGFLVIRDGCTVFKSPVQQHDFNFTYQLECGNGGDLPSSGQVFTIPIAPGDVIIAGTDGLFDNLYNSDITAVVVHAVRAGLGPQVAAQKIAALARQRAEDKNRQTPFSTAAQDAGFRYYGGKLDDITVIVSYITGHHNGSLSAKSSK
ncbi:probable protein phosphatase 2C 55 [Henckelia pumila]|uniref:probable protein phosphatase 2C 55 n=1 Tax=Henckelia pumila TaxID=405737 RepID=UPI003C6DFF32